MSIAIAAICTHHGKEILICASDRLETQGNISWEAVGRKKWIEHWPGVLMAGCGDISVEAELVHAVGRRSVAPVPVAPLRSPIQIARSYAAEYARVRRESSEREVLFPLGLTLAELGADPLLRDALKASKLDHSALFAGIPPVQMNEWSAPQIMCVQDPGVWTYEHGMPWATIGSGSQWADAELGRQGYSRSMNVAQALFAVYSAKKASEICTSVGSATDLFVIDEAGVHDLEGTVPFEELRRVHENICTEHQKTRDKYLDGYSFWIAARERS